MSSVGSGGEAEKCPVDHETRERWLQVARAKDSQQETQQHSKQQSAPTQQGGEIPAIPAANNPPQQPPTFGHRTIRPHTNSTTDLFSSSSTSTSASTNTRAHARWSLDHGRWTAASSLPSISPASQPKRPNLKLSQDREVSSIPRALSTGANAEQLNSAERAALPSPSPNNETDTGHDRESGNWIYPSQEMFFNAMKRKGHQAEAKDMSSIVPIHNAVNERAWAEILRWEKGWGSERCGGPKLVSFAGDSKALTPKARWNSMMGYTAPFDRHDWVVERCGKKIDYVIDFYKGKDGGMSPLSFYLDVRPKLNSFEGCKMRMAKTFGMA